MKLLICLSALFALLVPTVHANTEKVIFVAPTSTNPSDSALFTGEHKLETLTPVNTTLRKSLPVIFPTNEQPRGLEHWYLLRGLSEGQRHEVRVCWAAVQPTEFWLAVFTASKIDQQTQLLQRHSLDSSILKSGDRVESFLFLRIQAAADFFSSNKTLMQHPPPVDVDIILDPYTLSVFPSSLLPTAVYLVVLAVGAWFLSEAIWSRLSTLEKIEGKQHVD